MTALGRLSVMWDAASKNQWLPESIEADIASLSAKAPI
jgi:hypothetical protein